MLIVMVVVLGTPHINDKKILVSNDVSLLIKKGRVADDAGKETLKYNFHLQIDCVVNMNKYSKIMSILLFINKSDYKVKKKNP